MSSRKTVRQLLTPLVGGITGSIDSGTATTAVLGGLVGGYLDDYMNLWKLVMPDAATAADQNRIVTDWTGLSGQATFGTRADTTYTSETYELYPPDGLNLQEINDALNRVLQKTRQTVRIALPLNGNQRMYSLGGWAWVNLAKHVRAISIRHSPNLVGHADFAVWGSGPTSAPSLWLLAGSNGTIARETTYTPPGKYNIALTRSGADVSLTYSVGPFSQDLQGEQIAFGAWSVATVASRARVGLSDGATTTNASLHTGGGTPEFLESTKTLAATSSQLDFIASVVTGDATARFWNPIAVKGSTIPDRLRDYGDDDYTETLLSQSDYRINGNVIHLNFAPPSQAQIVVYTAQPFPTLTTDSASTDCPDDVLKWGTLAEVARIMRPGIDRTRWDAHYGMAGQAYNRLSAELLQVNLPRPRPSQTTVKGA